MFARHHLFPASLAFMLLAGCATMAMAQPANTVHKTLSSTQTLPTGTKVEIQNLVGHVTVQQGSSQLKVVATVVAGGTDQAAAQALADQIRLAVNRRHGELVVHVHYPVTRYDAYHYIPTKGQPAADNSVHFLGITIHGSSSSQTRYQDHRVTVYRGKDKGVPLHVDLVVSLPAGAHAKVHNKVGRIDATNLNNTLELANDSGDMVASHIDGRLETDSDSGDVTITDMHGTLAVDADSGDVKLTNIQGNTKVEADSGDILAHGLHGNRLKLDADSGDIRVDGISGTLKLDADSGDIRLKNLGAVPRLVADSDAGDVDISGNLSGLASFNIESDAGDITIATPTPPAVHLDIRGSDIHVDWPSLANVQRGDNYFSGDVGKASGQGHIHADSGDVTLRN